MEIDFSLPLLGKKVFYTPARGSESVFTARGCSLYFSSELLTHLPLVKGSASSKVSKKKRLSIGSLELPAFTAAARAVARSKSCKVIVNDNTKSSGTRNESAADVAVEVANF